MCGRDNICQTLGLTQLLEPQTYLECAFLHRWCCDGFAIALTGYMLDELGRFITGFYVVEMLAERVMSRNPSAKILRDPRSN